MKAKQTAVEYLVDQLFPKALSIEQYHHIEYAKKMEKQQMIEMHDKGFDAGLDFGIEEVVDYFLEYKKKK